MLRSENRVKNNRSIFWQSAQNCSLHTWISLPINSDRNYNQDLSPTTQLVSTNGELDKSKGSGISLPRYILHLSKVGTVWPSINHWISLFFTFHVCKLSINTYNRGRAWGLNKVQNIKHSLWYLAHIKSSVMDSLNITCRSSGLDAGDT